MNKIRGCDYHILCYLLYKWYKLEILFLYLIIFYDYFLF